jgi:hypothetical protein
MVLFLGVSTSNRATFAEGGLHASKSEFLQH